MPADNGSLTLIATHPAMPEIVFKGKEYVYNHHLTVPYRPLGWTLPKASARVT